ncbi:mRNA interferase [Flavobacterium palustre]|uniref:mRNA interferase n=1 Tax=Flavobacterium palustre TaxID=1476463 RepID=A0ABQ1HFJ4_9FLAO|nr:type II toxin-antitoxin system PemK/MazF family toxin [Flavobacterium palustre]GGA73933.1 mRNA interferase [Flavobacterium palustre]
MDLKQYQIVLVNLDPTIGSEMKKTRPSVIISPNEMNKYLQTIVIAPMTSNSKAYPTRVEINHDKKKGWIVLDQIRTVDRQRIIKILGNLTEKEITKVKETLRETFVD